MLFDYFNMLLASDETIFGASEEITILRYLIDFSPKKKKKTHSIEYKSFVLLFVFYFLTKGVMIAFKF